MASTPPEALRMAEDTSNVTVKSSFGRRNRTHAFTSLRGQPSFAVLGECIILGFFWCQASSVLAHLILNLKSL